MLFTNVSILTYCSRNVLNLKKIPGKSITILLFPTACQQVNCETKKTDTKQNVLGNEMG